MVPLSVTYFVELFCRYHELSPVLDTWEVFSQWQLFKMYLTFGWNTKPLDFHLFSHKMGKKMPWCGMHEVVSADSVYYSPFPIVLTSSGRFS